MSALIHWVRQEHANGCGAACFAMLTGRTYAEAVAHMDPRDWTVHGCTTAELDALLAEDGFAVARKYAHVTGNERPAWPVAPFAPRHLCQVTLYDGVRHFVVMDCLGHVFDPNDYRPRDLSHYADISNIAGIVRIEREP